jgi:hypothetical protein
LKVANYQLDEILKKVSESPDAGVALKAACDENQYIKYFIEQACNDVWVNFDVNEISYTLNDYHRSMAGSRLLSKTTFYIYKEILLNEGLPLKTKRYQTKNLLEMLYKGEALILLAILQKNLPELYPNITHEIMVASV